MLTKLKKSARRLFISLLVALFFAVGATTSSSAAIRYYAVAQDGSWCGQSSGTSAGTFDVCWAASTGVYTFF